MTNWLEDQVLNFSPSTFFLVSRTVRQTEDGSPLLPTEQALHLTDHPGRISLHVSHFKKGQRSRQAAEQQPHSCLGQGRLGLPEWEAFGGEAGETGEGLLKGARADPSVLRPGINLCRPVAPCPRFLPNCSSKLPVSDSPRPFFSS